MLGLQLGLSNPHMNECQASMAQCPVSGFPLGDKIPKIPCSISQPNKLGKDFRRAELDLGPFLYAHGFLGAGYTGSLAGCFTVVLYSHLPRA